MWLYHATPARAQNPVEERVRIKTRVVFLDALVKDKKTGQPVRDLRAANFEVRDEGRPRTISYFSRGADALPRPLSLVLVLDLPIQYLNQPDVTEQLAAALQKLPQESRAALIVTWPEEEEKGSGIYQGRCRTLEGLTPDLTRVTTALRTVPALNRQATDYLEKRVKADRWKIGNIGTAGEMPARVSQGAMKCVSDEVGLLAASKDSHSQLALTVITYDIAPFDKVLMEKTTRQLLETGVTVNGIIIKLGFLHNALLKGMAGPYISTLGSALYAVRRSATETGGEVITVDGKTGFARALETMFDNLLARYSLGFTLDEEEQNDGRLHRLEVRVSAKDERGRERKLVVQARRGYYLPG